VSYNQCGCNHWTTPKCPANKCPWQGLRPVDRALKAEAAPIVPQGWKLVPVEPTPEMVRAGQELKPLGKWHAQIKAVWTAMLAASPAPDASGVREVPRG